MLRSPGAFYYNAMMPHYALAYPATYKAAKKRKKKPQGVHPYKTKRFSLSYYLKYVLWKKIRRCWKKKRRQAKKKKSVDSSPSLTNRGSDEKIDDRDFWGSKYGSQWLFAKQKLQRQQQLRLKSGHNRLIEIVDAFKTVDLKYANRHVHGARTPRSRRSVVCLDEPCAVSTLRNVDQCNKRCRQHHANFDQCSRRCRLSMASNAILDQCNHQCRQSFASNATLDRQCSPRCRKSLASNDQFSPRYRKSLASNDQCSRKCRMSMASQEMLDQYKDQCRQSFASSVSQQPSRSRRGLSGNENLFIHSPRQTDPKCPCVMRRRRLRADGFETDASDWSVSTPQAQRISYSKWPPHPPPGAKHCCGREEQLATNISRQHAYVYNWLYVDQLQNKSGLTLSKELLDQVRTRLGKKSRTASSRCSSAASWSSTLSRRERAKILKRQSRAKEKASVLWLLSKAFEGGIPSDLLEPFYRDQENIRRLKPKIVHMLSNAELYCLALVNIYSDPNYHNLDHQGVIQVLTRKGISLVETREAALNETTLVQTAPIRMNAHMSIIDGIISLYIKEVLIPNKIVEVVKKFSTVDINSEMPSNSEEAAVLWINKCCRALEQDIRSECSAGEVNKLPKIPVLQEISDVSDGCCIAAVISYYCPKYFRWQDVCWNTPISLGDSIYNLQLVQTFCTKFLPRQISFLSLEDLLYLHPSIKENVLVFVADLLYMFVIYKADCVSPRKRPAVVTTQESSHNPLESSKSLSSFQSHKTPALCSPIPNLRSDSYGGSTSSLPDIRPGSRARSKENLCEKVLRKKSNYPTDDMVTNELQLTNSMGLVNGWKTTALPHVSSTDSVASSPRTANPELARLSAEGESASSHHSQPSICSAADDSILPKNILGRREDPSFGLRKYSESTLHGYRTSGDGHTNGVSERKSRKSLEDYYNQLAGVEGPLRSVSASNIIEDRGKGSPNSHESVPESTSSQSSGICLSEVDFRNNFSTTSFAQLSKLREGSSSSINIVYMPNDDKKSPHTNAKRMEGEGKRTTFAALPNTTTWQQQKHASSSNIPQTDSGHETPTEPADTHLTSQLCNLKMKLEDKKRKIELKKKRMEMLWKKQRQKLGKAAFLQAVSKSPGTPDSGKDGDFGAREQETIATPAPMVKRMSMHEIAADLDNVQKKWLHQNDPLEQIDVSTEPTLDIDQETLNIDLQTSIEHLNTSLTDLQLDISRISLQQEQVESLMKDSIDDGSHFFLHSPSVDESVQSFNAELSTNSVNWQFNESCSRQGIYFPSDELAFLKKTARNQDFAPAPKPQTNEDLYSKVVKQEKRQPPVRSPTRQDDRNKKPQKAKSTEIHVTLPQVQDSVEPGTRRQTDDKQGFYIPIEKEVRKVRPRPQKRVTVASNADMPNPVPLTKTVPTTEEANSLGFVIGADLVHPDPEAETEMARKKELIMNLSIQRKAEYERKRLQKEQEFARIREEEQRKTELQERKREEEKRRREAILEQYRQRKLQEEMEKEGALMPREVVGRFRQRNRRENKPRPKSAYVHMNSDLSSLISLDNAANKRNSHIFQGREMGDFDLDSLNSASTNASSNDRHRSPNNGFHHHRNNLQLPEGSGPSSDGASDTASNGSSAAAGDYTGPKLFVKPAAKSNRGIIINAINTVLAGAVNGDTKKKVLEEINRSESKHFLILFRDAGCQFRALYTYNPDREEVTKLFGIGPKNVIDKMMERFYKYNSGGKCFSEIQTKHLTVTIDAFTIPNTLWAGKKMVPAKKEFL
ncbi:hypothetical protein JTE90_008529 [Oedothorax gibbosus]|uniref:Patronin n=1 Tax=Oedothorax gibbosus TaxID=931172 RepID=A0AAV6VIU4_9ARAC|nr:hypothetical protein JTE90_008529 [Oedothorax gibbosus]